MEAKPAKGNVAVLYLRIAWKQIQWNMDEKAWSWGCYCSKQVQIWCIYTASEPWIHLCWYSCVKGLLHHWATAVQPVPEQTHQSYLSPLAQSLPLSVWDPASIFSQRLTRGDRHWYQIWDVRVEGVLNTERRGDRTRLRVRQSRAVFQPESLKFHPRVLYQCDP